MKDFKSPVLIYLFSTISFSILYFCFWEINTTSFVISEQINEKTYDIGIYSLEEIAPYYIRDNDIPFAIHEFNQTLLKPIFDTIKILEHDIESISVIIPTLKNHLDTLSSQLNQSYSSNLENTISEQTQTFRDSIEEINKKISKISQINTLDKDITVANFKVDIAQLELSMVKRESEIRTIGLQNLSIFQDKTIRYEVDSLHNRYISYQDKIFEIEKSIRDYKVLANERKNLFHQNRIVQLKYPDFLYFSVLSSISVSYGDIVPNTFFLRMVVTLQILISIFCLGILINKLAGKKE